MRLINQLRSTLRRRPAGRHVYRWTYKQQGYRMSEYFSPDLRFIQVARLISDEHSMNRSQEAELLRTLKIEAQVRRQPEPSGCRELLEDYRSGVYGTEEAISRIYEYFEEEYYGS